jgi:hydrogenase maturation factor HypF (carbamoyltransferase family)
LLDRDIVTPQDDSVIQFTQQGNQIIIRRSRGLAPNYFPNPFPLTNEVTLAMGAELKVLLHYWIKTNCLSALFWAINHRSNRSNVLKTLCNILQAF